jgi:hypothetical protein
MAAVPFDDSAKCNGPDGRAAPLCLTCKRLTLRPGAPIKGAVYLDKRGTADCESWKPIHAANVRGEGKTRKHLTHGGGDIPTAPKAGVSR